MRPTIFDLANDSVWSAVASNDHARVVTLPAQFWGAAEASLVLVDGRGRFDHALGVLGLLTRCQAQAPCVLLTECESPPAHRRAYLAGATRVFVAAVGELDVAQALAVLSEATSGGAHG